MSLLAAAAVARRASSLLRPMAAAASIRRMSSSCTPSSIEALRAEAASFRAEATSYRDKAAALRAEAASYRDKADALRASSHDSELVRIIESVKQSNNCNLVEEIPSDFPFKISKNDGLTDITLTRSLKGEQIEILVSMPTLDQDEDRDSSSSDGYTSYSDEDENHPREHTVPFTVTVSKADGSNVEFECTAYPDKIEIDTVSMRQPSTGAEKDEDAIASEDEEGDLTTFDDVYGFSELEEDLQQALNEYLALRGINPVNAKILYEHMVSKDRRQYLFWLAKLSDFIKKD